MDTKLTELLTVVFAFVFCPASLLVLKLFPCSYISPIFVPLFFSMILNCKCDLRFLLFDWMLDFDYSECRPVETEKIWKQTTVSVITDLKKVSYEVACF